MVIFTGTQNADATFGTTVVFENSTHDCYFGVFLCSPVVHFYRRARALTSCGLFERLTRRTRVKRPPIRLLTGTLTQHCAFRPTAVIPRRARPVHGEHLTQRRHTLVSAAPSAAHVHPPSSPVRHDANGPPPPTLGLYSMYSD